MKNTVRDLSDLNVNAIIGKVLIPMSGVSYLRAQWYQEQWYEQEEKMDKEVSKAWEGVNKAELQQERQMSRLPGDMGPIEKQWEQTKSDIKTKYRKQEDVLKWEVVFSNGKFERFKDKNVIFIN